ncbi:MAG TPA: argininosuccinate lyase, partial [Prolixibacteraceae bacterium]|nr:argininosuccinate lyase [Prolixibacteraceae bacterium]
DYLFTVEAVNELVMKGMPFRDAYKEVGRQVAEGKFVPDKTVSHTHEGSIGNLCLGEIRQKMERVLVSFGFKHYHEAIRELLASANPG